MGREITITDTTLRDGQQSLWAGRMPTDMMLPVAQHQERSGVQTVDTLGHNHFVGTVRFLRENPWERLRALRRILSRPKLLGAGGSQTIGNFKRAPADVKALFMQVLIRNGLQVSRSTHGLLDVESYVPKLKQAKELGATTMAGFVFAESPAHTDELYEARVREICERAPVDSVMIKDSGGLLTPERTPSLVAAFRRAAGNRQLTMHSHCTTGMAQRVYMISLEHGVDDLQCAIWPLALGSSQPSLETTVRNVRDLGYEVDVDLDEVRAASRYLEADARRRGFPLGKAVEYDHSYYGHQLPGGMLTILEEQLRAAGLLDRWSEVLEEAARVREELGWPTMVTPYSQFVVNQALLNVIGTGERYSSVPDQLKMYVLGHYGKPLGPIDQDVLDRIMDNGPAEVTETIEEPPPALPSLRKAYPSASDEELLLRYMNDQGDVDATLAAQAAHAETWAAATGSARQPSGRLVDLVAQAASLCTRGEIVLQKDSLRIRVSQ